ncbi:ROK family transcriptional regulator [Candidatus Sumerlaeota bacterium]|nr:ROK family transcriptional regulator [Candidatus Sumerlaeota bacterium]
MKIRKLNTETSSKLNRSLVLGLIYWHPLISRAEIADRTGLDRSTVTHILNYFLKEGLVEEVAKGKAGSRGGRCPILLQINYNSRFLIAIELGTKKVEGILTTLRGEEVYHCQRTIKRGEPLLEILTGLIEKLRNHDREAFQKSVVIGISCPGVIDTEKGVVRLNLYHQWKDVAVVERLSKRYKKPVFVENDANAAAMGELRQLSDDGIRSLIYLFIRESPPESEYLLGVGGALVFNGRLWHGAHFSAGEVAQTINTLFQKMLTQQWNNAHLRKPDRKGKTLDYLLRIAGKNDPYARRTVNKIADELGKLLSELVAFLDPEGVMVYLHPPEGKQVFLEKIQKAFYRHHNHIWGAPVRFLPALLGTRATLSGLIAIAQEKLFVSDATHSSLFFE